MLKKFSVENFKGFKDKITFDIGSPSNYSFNSEIIDNGCVTKGIVYGINSCGKSNLGLAIFDIIIHLTEKNKLLRSYDLYLNMSGRKSFAEFEYAFTFDGHEVIYRYKKSNVETFQEESLSIDEKEVVYYDFVKGEGFTRLEGSETLNATIKNDSPISRVKYVNSNSILVENTEAIGETEVDSTESVNTEAAEKESGSSSMIIVIIGIVAVIAAAVFFMTKKKK